MSERPRGAGARRTVAAAAPLVAGAAGLLLWTVQCVPSQPAPASQLTPAATARTPAPTPTPTPIPQTGSPDQAAALVRAAVTGAQPVLLPGAVVGAGWLARVAATTPDSFLVTYTDPTGARTVTVGEGLEHQPNPALPVASTAQSHPSFHGDRRSFYQVNDAGDPTSPRVLVWREPGTYDRTDPSYPGLPYFVGASGLTDAQFWEVVNSLR